MDNNSLIAALALLLAPLVASCPAKEKCREQRDCLDGYVCRDGRCFDLHTQRRCIVDADCRASDACVTLRNVDDGYCLSGDPGDYCTEDQDCFFRECAQLSKEGVGVCLNPGDDPDSWPDGGGRDRDDGSCQRHSDCSPTEFCVSHRCESVFDLTCNQIAGSCQEDPCPFGTQMTSAHCGGDFEMCCVDRD